MRWLSLIIASAVAAVQEECSSIPRVSKDQVNEAVKLLLEFGAVVIEGAASRRTMQQLDADLQNETTFRGAEGSFAGVGTTRNAAKPLGESAVARDLAVNADVLGVAEKVLGPFCKRIILGTCSAINVLPVAAPAQPLHRDDSMWAGESLSGQHHFSVSAMWAVTAFSKDNGATRVVMHSHRNATPAVMDPGSVLLWLGSTLHGAGSHSGDPAQDDRRGLLFIYNLGFLRSEHNFHNAIPPDVLRSFPKQLTDLIGYDGANAMEHPWYTGPVYAQPYLGGPAGSASGDGVQFVLPPQSP